MILPCDLIYGLLLLLPPQYHVVLEFHALLICLLTFLHLRIDLPLVHLVLLIEFRNLPLELVVHVILESVHVELYELSRGLFQVLQPIDYLRVLSDVPRDSSSETTLILDNLVARICLGLGRGLGNLETRR